MRLGRDQGGDAHGEESAYGLRDGLAPDQPENCDDHPGSQGGADPPAKTRDHIDDDEDDDGQTGVDHPHRAAHLLPERGRLAVGLYTCGVGRSSRVGRRRIGALTEVDRVHAGFRICGDGGRGRPGGFGHEWAGISW